jgi:hypothetical protein
VLPRRDEPFPYAAVRDLLGIVRGLYRAEKAEGARRAELDRLARIGRHLVLALDLAGNEPGSVGARAAWEHADRACNELGGLVHQLTPAKPMIDAAQAAVTGRRAFRAKKNEPWR